MTRSHDPVHSPPRHDAWRLACDFIINLIAYFSSHMPRKTTGLPPFPLIRLLAVSAAPTAPPYPPTPLPPITIPGGGVDLLACRAASAGAVRVSHAARTHDGERQQ
eukprot:1191136-Prorocentrum_minimum.AAC.9